MSCISWNCRGLGRVSTVCSLKFLCRKHKSDFLFLSETKCGERRCSQVAGKIRMVNYHVVKSNKRAGGLCLMWTDEVEVTILFSLNFLIQVKLTHKQTSKHFMMFCAYGPPYWHLKSSFWNYLTDLIKKLQRTLDTNR